MSPGEWVSLPGRAGRKEDRDDPGSRCHGDRRDRASLDAALGGIETVISTANSVGRGGEDNPQSVDLEGNRNLIEAAREAGVEHFIFVSTLGADPDHPVPFMRGKGQSEASLRDSGMDYTILAPAPYMELWVAVVVGMPVSQGRPVTLVGEGRRLHSFISERDVAALAVAAAENPAARNEYLAIGGPEPLSWRDVVETYERVLSRSVPVEFVGMGEPLPGLPGPMPEMLAGMETYDTAIEMDGIARTFGVPLTSLETFVREQVSSQSA